MTETEALTAAASGLFGLLAFDFKRYYYWWKWSGRVVLAGLLLLLAGNAGIGFAAYALARLVHWDAAGGAWLAAAQYAVAGQALVRTQFRAYDLDRAEGALTILALAAQFVVGGLDVMAKKKVEQWVRELKPREIRMKASELLDEIAYDDNVKDDVKEKLMANVKEASEEMRSGPDRDTARGTINGFCIRQISTGHLTV
jgi:hypothetical protein